MALYTGNSINKRCRQDLILIVLSLQSKLDQAKNHGNNEVLEEVSNLSDTVTKLISKLSITKNVKYIIIKQISYLRAAMLRKCLVFNTTMSVWTL